LGKDCPRIHPARYKVTALDKVVVQIMGAKGDFKEVLSAVLDDKGSFLA
jgi:hypothetical protein